MWKNLGLGSVSLFGGCLNSVLRARNDHNAQNKVQNEKNAQIQKMSKMLNPTITGPHEN